YLGRRLPSSLLSGDRLASPAPTNGVPTGRREQPATKGDGEVAPMGHTSAIGTSCFAEGPGTAGLTKLELLGHDTQAIVLSVWGPIVPLRRASRAPEAASPNIALASLRSPTGQAHLRRVPAKSFWHDSRTIHFYACAS